MKGPNRVSRPGVMLPVLVLLSAAAARAGDQVPVPRMTPGRTARAPDIDGRLDEDAWSDAPETAPFLLFNTPKPPLFTTRAKLLYDDENLYVAFEAMDPDIAAWLAPSGRVFDGEVWMDDCLEIYVADPSSPRESFQFVVNYDGVGFDRSGKDGGIRWNGIWDYAVHADRDRYTAEFAIPFHVLGLDPAREDFRLNLCREKYVLPSELSSWSCAYGDFHFTERFGEIRGVRRAPWAVALVGAEFPEQPARGRHRLRVAVGNNASTPWRGALTVEDHRDGAYREIAAQALELRAGEKTDVEIAVDLSAGGEYRLSLGLRADGSPSPVRQIYRHVRVPRALTVENHAFILMRGEEHAARVLVARPDASGKIVARIFPDADGRAEIRATAERSLAPDETVVRIPLPVADLPPGDYRVDYALAGTDGGEATESRPLKIISSPWDKP